MVGDIDIVFIIQAIVHGPQCGPDKDESNTANNDAEDVEGEFRGIGFTLKEGCGGVYGGCRSHFRRIVTEKDLVKELGF